MNADVPIHRPSVAKAQKPASVKGAAIALTMLGFGVFFMLSEARAARMEDGGLPSLQAAEAPAPAPLPGDKATAAPKPDAPSWFVPNGTPLTLHATDSGFASQPAIVAPPLSQSSPPREASRFEDRLRAPALVVDIAQAAPPPGPPGAAGTAVRNDGGALGPQTPAPDNRNLSSTEQFSDRVGNEDVQVAHARQMTGLSRLIPQGALIGAVMETALNSDLPGFARAVVQRDVYSFDGSAVLIPAGSRLIGQYKSGVAQGASRVFVLWTRLIRPDGVSIELASPATDDLGRGGIGGKVNRHFLQRFGGAILTTVLSGGINAASAALAGGSTILVGNAGEATSLATQATQNSDIPPTITTKPGATIRVFVARDLDFSAVGPAK
ncbi:TrbI/VirB10 family protein [Sphingomonas sp.]|uniref:TrbI/VirB10 family protein n=1 Tax=Sphingomonas sp. TaxID=28214 RepID=UPI0025F61D03|nr:TrbI/VirB10 family protein [Sphingomonas sp.]MBV9528433.1 TrbI/VirB10 family protein [Sphingomonas sp.]